MIQTCPRRTTRLEHPGTVLLIVLAAVALPVSNGCRSFAPAIEAPRPLAGDIVYSIGDEPGMASTEIDFRLSQARALAMHRVPREPVRATTVSAPNLAAKFPASVPTPKAAFAAVRERFATATARQTESAPATGKSQVMQASFNREAPLPRPLNEWREPDRNLDQRIDAARALERDQRLAEAIRQYESICADNVPNPLVLHRLAVLYDRTGQAFRSLPLYEQALSLDPANAELLCDFGFRWHRDGDPRLAERFYRRALYYSPEHSRTHNNFAVLLAQHRFDQPALQHFIRAGLNREEAEHNLAIARETADKPQR